MARISLLAYLLSLLSTLSTLSVVSAQSGSGIIGYGISFWEDLCCQACYDSLSALYLNCTTFSDGGDGASGMDMGGSGDGGMDMVMGTTSDACRASNTPWLQTMAYCIQSKCNAHGYTSTAKQEACYLGHALDGDVLGGHPTYAQSIPATAPTVELASNATWLNITSLVNTDLYESTYGSEGNFADSERYHTKYSMIIYLTTIGIIVACGVFAQLRGALPTFQRSLQTSRLWAALQQHVFLPALFGRRSKLHEPFLGSLGYLPSRPLGLFIGVYTVLNIVLSSVSFSAFSPNTFWMSPEFNLCEFVGNRTGTLSLVNLSMAILFAGRNNLLLALTGWSQTTFLILHRWAARVATVQAVVHSIVYTLAYFEPGYGGASAYAAQVAMPFYWWGIVATIAFCLVVGFSMLPIRARLYELFLVVHIALAILALVGCWYHLVPHFGYVYGYQTWLYICFAFWAFDRVARVARLLYFSRLAVAGGVQATVEAVPGSDSIVHVTVFPRTWHYGPGQHTFLYFPSLGWGKGWESHPFSVAAWNDGKGNQQQPLQVVPSPLVQSASLSSEGGVEDANLVHEKSIATASSQAVASTQEDHGASLPHCHYQHNGHMSQRPSIEFLVRDQSGMTKWLRDYAVGAAPKTPGRRAAIELPLYTEGPYAGHRATLQPLSVADTILCVVGGIGITHVLSILQEYVAHRRTQSLESKRFSRSRVMTRATRFIVAWSTHETALLEHVQERFLVPSAQVDGLEYHFWCTNPTMGAKGDGEADGQDAPAVSGSTRATPGRMNVGSVIRSSLEVGRLTTVVVCGPGSMADEANREVVQCVKEGFRVDSIEEMFGW